MRAARGRRRCQFSVRLMSTLFITPPDSLTPCTGDKLGGMEPANLVLALIACVVVYVLLAAIRAVFFPHKPPQALEYRPRQVRERALLAPLSRRRLSSALGAMQWITMRRSRSMKARLRNPGSAWCSANPLPPRVPLATCVAVRGHAASNPKHCSIPYARSETSR